MLNRYIVKSLNRINHQWIWALYSRKCNKILEKPYFIFSFDCDTEEDIAVAWDVHTKLIDIGIIPVYAVPGELLKKGEKTYDKIFATGAEFINHGGKSHTYFDLKNNRHASCFFYDEQPLEVLKDDIILGHQILKAVLGVQALGWRTPHFGTFQEPTQLKFLYTVLNELNYQFSSSTTPEKAYIGGPLYKVQNIFEIPVTGVFTEPLNIMDTWAYFSAPERTKSSKDYLTNCDEMVNFIAEKPILINIYGDPSHIYDKIEFFKGMEYLTKNMKNINYTQLLSMMHENVRNF